MIFGFLWPEKKEMLKREYVCSMLKSRGAWVQKWDIPTDLNIKKLLVDPFERRTKRAVDNPATISRGEDASEERGGVERGAV